jgi:sec-independent protein translocase protein TatC
MASHEPEEDYSHPHDEGGPTKTFLEHLEDLRWVLMKSGAAFMVAFMLCLFASPTLVKVLTRPLEKANIHNAKNSLAVTLLVGTNRVGTFLLETNQPSPFGTNMHTVLEVVPVQIGSNLVLALKPAANQDLPPTVGKGVNLVNLGPASAFFLAFQMAIYGGIALASPFLFYFIGQFVFPALKLNEKKYTYWGLGIGAGLFATGVCFCYFILMPVALRAAVQYSEWMGFQAEMWRAEEYVIFVSKFLLGMGLGFEMPVVLLVLVKIGVLTYRQLASFRRYMIVINLVLGAILTTPEVITQLLMAIPLQLLYEVSVWIAWYWERQEKKRRGVIELEE